MVLLSTFRGLARGLTKTMNARKCLNLTQSSEITTNEQTISKQQQLLRVNEPIFLRGFGVALKVIKTNSS